MKDTIYLEKNKIHQGDARELLKLIEPNSISLSVWSPPYHVGKNYELNQTYDQWQSLLQEVIKLHHPILKPGGFLAINIDDILAFPDPDMPRFQAANLKKHRVQLTKEDILQALNEEPTLNKHQLAKKFNCSEQTIERRLKGNNIRGGKYNIQTKVKRAGPVIEQAGEAAGLYLYDRRIWKKDPAWNNSQWHSNSYKAVSEFEYIYLLWKPGETTVDRDKLTKEEWTGWGSRGVWSIPSVRKNDDHEAKFPIILPQRLIKLLTNPKDTVLDCFMGSGTTALASISEDRNYVGIEKEAKYVDLGNNNIKDYDRAIKTCIPDELLKAKDELERESLKAKQLEFMMNKNEFEL